MRLLPVALAAVWCAGTSATEACGNVLAQDQLVACLGVESDRAEKRLTAAYERARKANTPEKRVVLEKSQAAWLASRDRKCELEASEAKGGQVEQPIYISCQTKLTELRVRELQRSGQ